ncbi:hypothetical protein CC2G_003041 [Coprinopsis cinerea AmutBmut pab1-1]|nr:hypothetical protein CC2G_003041 [Coprinopsis cinerea AmutBmut pab1-1]
MDAFRRYPVVRRAPPWAEPQPLSQKTLPPILAAALAETLLYGIHAVLFIICVYFLLVRTIRLQWTMLSGIVIMFLLATADVAFSFHTLLGRTHVVIRGTTLTFLERVYPKYLIYVTNNFIAVVLMITRFYVVWGQRKYLLVVAGVPLLVVTGLGYASHIREPETLRRFVPIFFLINLVLNNVLTFLTATRIFWISTSSSDVLGRRVKQYRVTSAVMYVTLRCLYRVGQNLNTSFSVESGVLYSISMLLVIAIASTPWITLATAMMLRIVCIAPVLIVAQIAVGHATRNPNKIHARTEPHAGTSIVLDTIIRTDIPDDLSMEVTSTAPGQVNEESGVEEREEVKKSRLGPSLG